MREGQQRQATHPASRAGRAELDVLRRQACQGRWRRRGRRATGEASVSEAAAPAPLRRHELEAKIAMRAWPDEALRSELLADPAARFAKYAGVTAAQLPRITVYQGTLPLAHLPAAEASRNRRTVRGGAGTDGRWRDVGRDRDHPREDHHSRSHGGGHALRAGKDRRSPVRLARRWAVRRGGGRQGAGPSSARAGARAGIVAPDRPARRMCPLLAPQP